MSGPIAKLISRFGHRVPICECPVCVCYAKLSIDTEKPAVCSACRRGFHTQQRREPVEVPDAL